MTKIASREYFTISPAPGTTTGAAGAFFELRRVNSSVPTIASRIAHRHPRAMLIDVRLGGGTGAATDAVAVIARVAARFATRGPDRTLMFVGDILRSSPVMLSKHQDAWQSWDCASVLTNKWRK
jgi:hypothetical protein